MRLPAIIISFLIFVTINSSYSIDYSFNKEKIKKYYSYSKINKKGEITSKIHFEFDWNTLTTSPNCNFEDGKYISKVTYYNPKTSYSAKYRLYVEVEDCQVVKIYFPKGGHLDNDHITYADIDDDGDAKVYGENGVTYKVHIDN